MTVFTDLTKEQNDIAQLHEELSILSRKVYEKYPTKENKDDLVQSLTNFKEYLESVQ